MKTTFKNKKYHYQSSFKLFFILVILVNLAYGIFLFCYSIKQNIITIGIFSEKSDSLTLKNSINRILSTSSEKDYQKGVIALENAGYKNSYLSLFLNQYSNIAILFIFLFLILIIISLLIQQKKNQLYTKEIEYIIEWIDDISLEIPKRQHITCVPSTMITAIISMKKKGNQQKIISEEDNTQIMKYMENISHQLKTPLAIISATCERLSMSHPEIEDKLTNCIAQTNRMIVLIHDFLQLGRFDCNKQKMHFETIHAFSLIETIINNLSIFANKKNLTLITSEKPDLLWYCDIFWMEEILSNIIKNCIEHSENGSIVIQYHQFESKNQVLISDCGIGFKNGFEEKIFERYSFIDRTNLCGSGLGLSIAQQAIKSHFGTITAANKQEGGVEFRLSFPQLDPNTIYH